MPDIPEGWFPVFTLLLGYAAKVFSDWLQQRRTRLDQLAERRTTFQRQTLLQLQEAVMELVRTTGAMHAQDLMAFRKTGQWQRQLFGEALSEGNRLAHASTFMLTVRARDDSVRDLVQIVKNHAVSVNGCSSEEEAQHAMTRMDEAFEKLNQRIGKLLRKLDDEPV